MTDSSNERVTSVQNTTCCIVGGGPGGLMLSLLLARRGVDVTLLEAHHDFDRDFRGDTIHPSTLEILDDLGIVEPLLQMPHGKVSSLTVHSLGETTQLMSLERLRTRFPYIMMLPQVRFLEYVAECAKQYPNFHLRMGANVQRLVQDNGVRGVRYRDENNAWHEVRADLTVGFDGRFSKLRKLIEFEPVKTSPPMDVVWFRLPRHAADPKESGAFYIANGHLVVLLDRADHWQIGYVILKGSYSAIRKAGIEELQQSLATIVPWMSDRVEELHDWNQVAILAVESSRLEKWYSDGLLLLGDAAHVMSPVAGVGINYAIQDAVEAANILGPKLLNKSLEGKHLRQVQKRREWPTRVIQTFQAFVQQRVVAQALKVDKPFRLPPILRLLLRIPGLRNLPGYLVAFGVRRVKVED